MFLNPKFSPNSRDRSQKLIPKAKEKKREREREDFTNRTEPLFSPHPVYSEREQSNYSSQILWDAVFPHFVHPARFEGLDWHSTFFSSLGESSDYIERRTLTIVFKSLLIECEIEERKILFSPFYSYRT